MFSHSAPRIYLRSSVPFLSSPSKPTASSLSNHAALYLPISLPFQKPLGPIVYKCRCRRYPSSLLSPRRRYPFVVAIPSSSLSPCRRYPLAVAITS
ncbi:hypothetical protein PGTUg99_002704 [Puccinia graminis f. sp. tritici]|uniref:Uncharacterized protein n=1 Tax=Puccinia graminis f. sp. tritici TaxID=56615 RepID=A0A5B0S8H0_PUCGR|nr:hypothetical protein PGTUg99_002704 [Puccinia graminis f. sp. tritici]